MDISVKDYIIVLINHRDSQKNEQYDECVGMVASGGRVCSNSRRR